MVGGRCQHAPSCASVPLVPLAWPLLCTGEYSITDESQDAGAMNKSDCTYVKLFAANIKGERHGYSHRQQLALSWIHLFHRHPNLARVVGHTKLTIERTTQGAL
jgi:hypothetical protein